MIACKWNQAYLFWNGLACVQDSSGKFGFINKKGELVISCRWMQVSGYFSKKYKYGDYVVAVFGKRFFFGEPKWYIINKRGHIIDTIDTSPKEVDFMGKKYKMEIFKPESPDFGC